MKNVLVTGGAGYIGSHTCKKLLSNGFQPIIYDNLSTGHRHFVKWGPLIEGDILDRTKLITVFKNYNPCAVIHFAASAYVGESTSNPLKYYSNNVAGTLSLLEAMTLSSISYLVFSSTCATYGIANQRIISEDSPQTPINPYGRSKLMVETILTDISAVQQIKHVCLRYFNAAGADIDGEIGELHDPETHLIPLAIKSCLKSDVLYIYGDDFPTEDGTAVRDYIHVNDLANAHVLSLNYLVNGGNSNYFNLGTGRGYSVKEVINILSRMGLRVNSQICSRRLGDPAYLVADPTKAANMLQWKPEYTDMSDIVNTAVQWYLSNA